VEKRKRTKEKAMKVPGCTAEDWVDKGEEVHVVVKHPS